MFGGGRMRTITLWGEVGQEIAQGEEISLCIINKECHEKNYAFFRI